MRESKRQTEHAGEVDIAIADARAAALELNLTPLRTSESPGRSLANRFEQDLKGATKACY